MIAGKTVADILGRRDELLTIQGASTVSEAARKMTDQQVGSLVVVGPEGTTIGIITERDIMNKIIARGGDPKTNQVKDVMTSAVISVAWSTPFEEAQRLMTLHCIRHLLIRDGEKTIGIISAKDILKTSLVASEMIIRKQAKILQNLELQHPGITQVRTDRAGRLLI
jgi:CBS domain-containing protein